MRVIYDNITPQQQLKCYINKRVKEIEIDSVIKREREREVKKPQPTERSMKVFHEVLVF